ncbi:transcriptional regulator of RNA polII, SAGA, subunit-domain-containing protein [Gigaspora rosea]|uniref:Transcriptional regulator of RNA polII, SAGA, subunit-domain-containing protein n=1 Tax=Gigaspora rosea TaxID=44941 RepID=A0A397VS86_9GLOM|nr:transcriptional regulator of RNA polII, SAGA, subunit-domain-containing protein [Gigaspora rosea]
MNSHTIVRSKDPIMLKTQLDTALGDNKVQYWKAVQSFIKGELTQLHDDFIRASINNNKQKSNCRNVKNSRNSNEKELIPKGSHCSKSVSENSISQRDFPDYENVYIRMTEIAFNNGLFGGVQEDCVSLMVFALELYLKNILHNCINQIRENNVYRDDYDENPSITLKDLAFSLSISPLTVSPLIEEKINARLRRDEMNFDNEI